jgi:hypothetical protein
MPIGLAITCILAAPPVVPQATVELQARAIRIPALPEGKTSVAEYRALRGQLDESLHDLEQDLAATGAALAARPPLPSPLTVPSEHAETARTLVRIANGREFQPAETAMLDAWSRWQDFLRGANLAEAAPPPTPAAAPAEDEALRQRLATIARPSQQRAALDHDMAAWMATTGHNFDERSYRLSMERAQVRVERQATTQQLQAVVKAKAPGLAEAWRPLAGQLNNDAATLAELEGNEALLANPTLRTLQLRARNCFLERVRRTLWLCATILSQENGEPPPPPWAAPAIAQP